jgi:glycosyltransferase 2 family protein
VTERTLTTRPPGVLARFTRKYARVAVTLVLLTWVAWETNWQEVGSAFARLRLELWLAAVAVLVATQFVSAWRWQALARPFGFERSIGQLVSYYFIGMYFNLLLPTSVGGDVVRAWYLDGHSGRRLAAFVAVFVDRFSGLVVLLSLACAGVVLWPLELPAWIPLFVWTAAGGAVLAVAGLPRFARHSKRVARRLDKVRQALRALRAPRLLLGSTLLSLGVQAGNVILVWLIGNAIGAEVPGGYYWIMVPMVSLLAMLPVSINGMGVREGATALFLAHLGVPDGTAKTLALLWFAVFLTVSLLGGVVYLFGHFPKPVTPTATMDETEVDDGSIDRGADQGRAGQHRAVA